MYKIIYRFPMIFTEESIKWIVFIIIILLSIYIQSKGKKWISQLRELKNIIYLLSSIFIILYGKDIMNHKKSNNYHSRSLYETKEKLDEWKSKKARYKRNVTTLEKKVVAANQKWKCMKCNQLLDATYEVDHIVPICKGGDNGVKNLQALCRNCHGKKTIYDLYI